MLKVKFRSGVLLGALFLFAPSAVLAVPLTITKTRDLVFGSFVGGAGLTGTITVNYSGLRSASGKVLLLSGATYSAAQFTVSGNAGTRYTITLPATLTVASGTAQMVVSGLTASVPATGVLPAGGTMTFTVGGTVTVNATQQGGDYLGSFDVSLARN